MNARQRRKKRRSSVWHQRELDLAKKRAEKWLKYWNEPFSEQITITIKR